MNEVKEPIIDMHDSWLVINSVQGCTNGCKYCFLQGINNNLAYPKILCSPKEVVDKLLEFKYYDSNIPICLLPGTDAFLNDNNINYVHELLNYLCDIKISNPIILITKCLIPENILNDLEAMTNNNMEVVVYLSYSGLTSIYEPSIKHENIKLNFEHLASRGIKVIHYYRPFVKENSDAKQIESMLDYVHQYTSVSQIGGLKLRSDFIDKINFMDVVKKHRQECLDASSLWPKEAYDYFYNGYNHKHSVFQTNICALNEILEKPSVAFYNTLECKNYNHCNNKDRCMKCKKLSIDEAISLVKEKLEKFNYNLNDITITKDDNNIILRGKELSSKDAAYLTMVIGYKVTVDVPTNDSWKSTMTNSKPYIY